MKEHSENKSILFINYEYPPIGAGGGNANQEIARRLVDAGHRVSVMTSRFKGLPNEEERFGVNIIRIPTLRRREDKCSVLEMLIFLLMSLFYCSRVFRKTKPQVVIAFFSIPCGPAALLLNYLYSVPFVVALRGGDVPGFLPEELGHFHRMSNWLTRWIWKRSSALTANSKGLGQLALNFFEHENLEIIPNGVDDRYFHSVQDKPKNEKLQLLAVGRLSPQKKVDRLLDVMSRLKDRNIQLKIAGDGPLAAELKKHSAFLKLDPTSVVFEGWCQKEKLIDLYKEADILVMASDFEGMPNVILEAMASSLAIVATEAPGTEELVKEGENGYLISKNHLESFDDRLLSLLDSAESKIT